MVSFINLYPIPVLFGSTCDLRDLLLTLAEPPIHTDFFQASPMSERHIPIKCLRKRPIQIALEKKKEEKKTSNKKSWRIQDMLVFPCTVTLFEKTV